MCKCGDTALSRCYRETFSNNCESANRTARHYKSGLSRIVARSQRLKLREIYTFRAKNTTGNKFKPAQYLIRQDEELLPGSRIQRREEMDTNNVGEKLHRAMPI